MRTTTRFEAELAEACTHYNIGLLVYGALAGGAFTDKYLEDDLKAKEELARSGSRHVKYPDFQPRYHCEQNMAAARR